jgi:hypothetical protein
VDDPASMMLVIPDARLDAKEPLGTHCVEYAGSNREECPRRQEGAGAEMQLPKHQQAEGPPHH